jgi:uncharacterized membrane protein YiaA
MKAIEDAFWYGAVVSALGVFAILHALDGNYFASLIEVALAAYVYIKYRRLKRNSQK